MPVALQHLEPVRQAAAIVAAVGGHRGLHVLGIGTHRRAVRIEVPGIEQDVCSHEPPPRAGDPLATVDSASRHGTESGPAARVDTIEGFGTAKWANYGGVTLRDESVESRAQVCPMVRV
jgi:hypothetical protein